MIQQPKSSQKRSIVAIGWFLFFALLVATLVAEFFIPFHSRFGIDGTRFFHAWFGFFAGLGIIIIAAIIGAILRRSTKYYEEEHHGK